MENLQVAKGSNQPFPFTLFLGDKRLFYEFSGLTLEAFLAD